MENKDKNNFMDFFSEFMKNQSGSTINVDGVEPFINDVETEEENNVNKDLNKDYELLYDKYIRLMAEFDNYRKRTNKEKEDIRNYGNSKTIELIIPIIDDFERALDNINDDVTKEGVALIYNKFISTLTNLGLEKIDIENNVTKFDTDIHDAVTMVNVKKKKLDKKIINCVQSGYKLNNKIIRHPKVIVGKYDN